MMKKKLYIALATVALLASCTKEDMNRTTPQGEVTFRAATTTRAAGNAWEEGDLVGVFAFNADATLTNGNKSYKIDNIATGAMSAVKAEDKILCPLDGSKASYIAYYPYNATAVIGTTYVVNTIDQSTAQKTKALDLMWAEVKNETAPSVLFTFSHRMTKLRFDIQAGGAEVTDLTGITATLAGATATATFDLKTGTFSAPATSNITLNAVVHEADKTKATIEAFVIPTANLSGVKLTLTAADKEFVWQPTTAAWTGGESYAYTITAGKTDGTKIARSNN